MPSSARAVSFILRFDLLQYISWLILPISSPSSMSPIAAEKVRASVLECIKCPVSVDMPVYSNSAVCLSISSVSLNSS